jgi:hypothetical protein
MQKVDVYKENHFNISGLRYIIFFIENDLAFYLI